MSKIPQTPPQLRHLTRPLARMVLTFFLSSAQIAHSFAPCALAAMALAGAGTGGLFCLLGCAAGAFFFFDFQPGLRFLASAILIYAANMAFYDTRLYRRPRFRPAICVVLPPGEAQTSSIFIPGSISVHSTAAIAAGSCTYIAPEACRGCEPICSCSKI